MNQQKSSTQQQISKYTTPESEAAWLKQFNYFAALKAPKPPTADAIKKAQFIDKTYHWKNAGIRSGN
jgi:hypothetical protein